jgi:catechol-2,3-dioxygenase
MKSLAAVAVALLVTASTAPAETPAAAQPNRLLLPGAAIRGAFFALSVKDARNVAKWYREQLGFTTVVERDVPERNIVAILLQRDSSLIEIIQRTDTQPAPTGEDGKRSAIRTQGVFKIGLTVADLQGLHDKLRAGGVQFDYHIVQPDGNPWKTFAVRDPEGNIVQFFG